jgi:hypothetical protein
VLLLYGFANVALSIITLAPDSFYHAFSLARENLYLETPDGVTALDGFERNRLFKKMKV